MFSLANRPRPGDRATARPVRCLKIDLPETLECRQSTSITGLTEVASFGPPAATPGGSETVTISGTVQANRSITPIAEALVFDEETPASPAILPVTFSENGPGTYHYSIPLALATARHAGDRSGRGYSVVISVHDPNSSASASANFALPESLVQSHPTHPGRPSPVGHRGPR